MHVLPSAEFRGLRDVSNTHTSNSDGLANISVIDQQNKKRYRMVLKGNAQYFDHLSIEKLKHHLAAGSCPIPAEEQMLYILGSNKERVMIPNNGLTRDYGIQDGSTLYMMRRPAVSFSQHSNSGLLPSRSHSHSHETLGSHTDFSMLQTLQGFGDGETELSVVLRQQKLLEDQRVNRVTQYEKQNQNLLQASQLASMKKSTLEEQARMAAAQAKLLEEAAAKAAEEQRRLAEVREKEELFEAARNEDLAQRTEQLHREQLKIKELQLLQVSYARQKLRLQQEEELYEAEQARVQQERETMHQQYLADQLRIRQQEVTVEKQVLDAEGRRQELELEKAIIAEQRSRSLGIDPSRHLHDTSHGIGMQAIDVSNLTANNAKSAAPTPPPQAPASMRQAGQASPVVSDMTGPSRARHSMADDLQSIDVREQLAHQLQALAAVIKVPSLQFDQEDKCVFTYRRNLSEHPVTLSLQFEAATDRLFLFTTILTHLPEIEQGHCDEVMYKLYEALLVNRQMGGYSVSVDLEKNYVLLSTSAHVPSCAPSLLAQVTPIFVDDVMKWRQRASEVLSAAEAQRKTKLAEAASRHAYKESVSTVVIPQGEMPRTSYDAKGKMWEHPPLHQPSPPRPSVQHYPEVRESSRSSRHDAAVYEVRRREREHEHSSAAQSQHLRKQINDDHEYIPVHHSGGRGREMQPKQERVVSRSHFRENETGRPTEIKHLEGGKTTSSAIADRPTGSERVASTSALWREYQLLNDQRNQTSSHNTTHTTSSQSTSGVTVGSPRTGYVSPLTDASTHGRASRSSATRYDRHGGAPDQSYPSRGLSLSSSKIDMSPPAPADRQVSPYLGVEVVDGDDEQNGVTIVGVKGPAMRAGLQAGDIVVAVEGYRVVTLDDFYRCMIPHQDPNVPVLQPNKVTVIQVHREGIGRMSIDVLVGAQTPGSPKGTAAGQSNTQVVTDLQQHKPQLVDREGIPTSPASSVAPRTGDPVRQLQFEAQPMGEHNRTNASTSR